MAEFIADLILCIFVEMIPLRWSVVMLVASLIVLAAIYLMPSADVPPAPSRSSSLGTIYRGVEQPGSSPAS